MGIERSSDDDKAALAELSSSRDFVVQMVAAGLLGMLNFRDRAKAWGDTIRQKDGFETIRGYLLEGWREICGDFADLRNLPNVVRDLVAEIFSKGETATLYWRNGEASLAERLGGVSRPEQVEKVIELRQQKGARWLFFVFSEDGRKLLLDKPRIRYLVSKVKTDEEYGYIIQAKIDRDEPDLSVLENVLGGVFKWEYSLIVLPDNIPAPGVILKIGEICSRVTGVGERTIGVLSSRIKGAIGMLEYRGRIPGDAVTILKIPRDRTNEITFRGNRRGFDGLSEFLAGDRVYLDQIVQLFADQGHISEAR